MTYTPDQIITLAKAVELEDSIDWANIHVDKDTMYNVAAISVCEQYNNWANTPEKDAIMMATIVKLVVENFALNLLKDNY